MRDAGGKAQVLKNKPTQARRKKKAILPEFIDRHMNSKDRVVHEGLCKDKPGMRVIELDETEDITFTFKELRAVKYPSHLARMIELRKYELKQAG